MLTQQQIAHFETFGFVVLRGLFSPSEMEPVGEGFEHIMRQDRGGHAYSGERQSLEPFAELQPSLTRLADDDRIYGPIEELLGPGFVWEGSDGNHYVGDTWWHPDKGGEAVRLDYRQIKVVFYLDALTRDEGCLRVIPGSHRPPFHHTLEPLMARDGEPSDLPFAVSQADVPSCPIETNPGDVIFFHQSLFHASFGGGLGRRMFTLVFTASPQTDDEVAYVRGFKVSFRPRKTLVNSDRSRVRGMMKRLVELGLEPIDP